MWCYAVSPFQQFLIHGNKEAVLKEEEEKEGKKNMYIYQDMTQNILERQPGGQQLC